MLLQLVEITFTQCVFRFLYQTEEKNPNKTFSHKPRSDSDNSQKTQTPPPKKQQQKPTEVTLSGSL